MDLITVACLGRNPTVKAEIKQKSFKDSIPVGFLDYPVSQVADITAFEATTVPVGDNQEPMLEQTRGIVRTFSRVCNTDILIEPKGYFPPEGQGGLPGLDGNTKVSKSLGNAVYLSDDAKTARKKITSIYTGPNHIHVGDPRQVEGNTVFTYLNVFVPDEDKAAELEGQYQKGGLGGIKIKRYLDKALKEELRPVRERHGKFTQDPDTVYEMLLEGSEKADKVANQTLEEVREAIGLNYLDRSNKQFKEGKDNDKRQDSMEAISYNAGFSYYTTLYL